MVRVAWLVVLIAGVVGRPSVARALERAQLDYQRGDGAEFCPDEHSVRRGVLDRLGYDPFDATALLLLRARLERRAERFTAVLELVDAKGDVRARRQLESDANCAELAAALALSMSIVIDPERAAAGGDASSTTATGSRTVTNEPAPGAAAPTHEAPPSAAAPRPETTPPLIASATPRAPEPRTDEAVFRGFLGALLHVALGTEPAPAPGVSLNAGVRQGRWMLSVDGRYDAPASMSLQPRGSLEARLIGAGLVPCRSEPPFLLCVVGLLGHLSAEATGVSAGRPDSGLFAAAGPRIGFEWPVLRGFSLRVQGEILVSLRPLAADLGREEPVWEVAPVTGLLAAGGVAQF